MRCAVVNVTSTVVENLIMADPSIDTVPETFLLISLPEDSPVAIGWTWDGINFVDPSPEVIVE